MKINRCWKTKLSIVLYDIISRLLTDSDDHDHDHDHHFNRINYIANHIVNFSHMYVIT